MTAFSSARLGANFAARRARFFSRSISASLATVTSVSERELEAGEQCLCFIVSLRSGRDADVQPTQRVHRTDRVTLTDLETCDCLACLRDHRLLARDLRQIANGVLDDLLVSDGF